ncbi:hypothetical protein [Pedobacter chinensis]|nr:hypothetical protein [Pedobacter chinensis]
MMNKLMLNKGKTVACLILLCLFLVQGCKKNDQYPAENLSLQNQLIDEDLIGNWFKENPLSQVLAPNWAKARQSTHQGKKIVRVPILNIDKSGKESALVNSGYDPKHPPELFFIQNAKGQLAGHLLNFIPKNVGHGNGEDGVWTGQLIEWNVKGDTLHIIEIANNKEIENKLIVPKSDAIGGSVNSVIKNNKLAAASSNGNGGFWSFLGRVLGAIANFLGLPTRDTIIDGLRVDWDRISSDISSWFDGMGNSSGGGGGTGGGYLSAGAPIYVTYLDGNYNPVSGGGASTDVSSIVWTEYKIQKGGPNRPLPILDVDDYIVTKLGFTGAIADYLMLHVDQQIALDNYLKVNGETFENIEFVKWAARYLTENPNLFNQAFRDLLNGVYNENSPIFLLNGFDIVYEQDWYDKEDEFGSTGLLLSQQGLIDSDPIPEMYYKNGTPVDMRPASAKNGFTIKNSPRNKDYFWKELASKRPEMFSRTNRSRLTQTRPVAPIIDEQWIKYNPTHKSYMGGRLIHHHDEQGHLAFAIPEKVHQKWSKILHDYKLNGKIPRLGGTLNSLISIMQIFTTIIDLNTSNPDAWINWFGAQNEVGKIYADPQNNKYWEIMDQRVSKNAAGVPTKAIVHYNVYADYIWDSDENRYMGVIKLNEFTEELDLINKTSKQVMRLWL